MNNKQDPAGQPITGIRWLFVFMGVLVIALAVSVLDTWSEFPGNGNAWQWYRAHQLFAAGWKDSRLFQLDEAKRKFDEAIAVYDKDPRFYRELGQCNLHLEHYEDAQIACQKAVQLDSRDERALILLSRADAALSKPEESEKAVRQALKLEPNDTIALAQLGVLLAANGKLAEARDVIHQAELMPSQSPEYWYLVGKYRMLLGRPNETESALRLAALDPTDPDYSEALGLCLLYLKKTDEAEQYLMHAVDVNPKVGSYWLALAEAQSQLGQAKSAAQAKERAQILSAGQAVR